LTRYLVDTNVLSELVGVTPDAAVTRFFARLPSSDLAGSAISRFEIERGLALMPSGRRRKLYADRYAVLLAGLGAGILPFDERAASVAAHIVAAARTGGRSLDDHLFDVLIAATASVHGLVVLTRNERPFHATGVPFENPWTGTRDVSSGK